MKALRSQNGNNNMKNSVSQTLTSYAYIGCTAKHSKQKAYEKILSQNCLVTELCPKVGDGDIRRRV